jgi:hypothetical protein
VHVSGRHGGDGGERAEVPGEDQAADQGDRRSGPFGGVRAAGYVIEEDSADGLFTARSDLAAAMLGQLSDARFVRKAMGVVTTQVRPNIAKLIWTEATRKRS